MVGYNSADGHAHTIKVVSWSQEDVFMLDLVMDWRRRRAYRKRYAEGSAEVDADILALHVGIALGWGVSLNEAALHGGEQAAPGLAAGHL